VSEITHPDAPLTDDGFHEIQLSGKQLVFLFMATTIVAVVIFLCGVQVGRNVKGGDRAADAGDTLASAATLPASPLTHPAAASGPPAAEPPAPAQEPEDELSYAKRLQGDSAPAEKLNPPSTAAGRSAAASPAAAPKPETTASSAPVPAKPEASPPTKAATPAPPPAPTQAAAPKHDQVARGPVPGAGPAGHPGAWIVQLSALQDRKAAASIVQQLAGKGYPAFVLDPAPGSPAIYRVQVGGYPDRAGAEQASRRLEKEEHFKGYVRSR
jgi:cell division septation protein DedD